LVSEANCTSPISRGSTQTVWASSAGLFEIGLWTVFSFFNRAKISVSDRSSKPVPTPDFQPLGRALAGLSIGIEK
jgi:hypothetical protein